MRIKPSQNSFLKTFLLVGTLWVLAGPGALAAPSECDVVFEQAASKEPLDRAIRNLAEMKLSLDIAQSRGGTSPATTALAANLRKKENELAERLEKHHLMTREQLTQRIKQEISNIQQDPHKEQQQKKEQEEESRRRKEQEQQFKKTMIDGTKAILHRIEPGSFKMGELGEQVDVILTKSFAMMATPTTQIIWKKVAELANAKYKMYLDLDPSHFKGETRPVESVSYDDVHLWLLALNELSKDGEPALAEIIPSHQKGDLYRLPTEAEWEFVIRQRGPGEDLYRIGDKNSPIKTYAWFSRNSQEQTHPVATKLPLVIDGDKEFFDMPGNVREWVLDWYDIELPGGTDPRGVKKYYSNVIRNGSWKSEAHTLRSAARDHEPPGHSENDLGFRFVREIR